MRGGAGGAAAGSVDGAPGDRRGVGQAQGARRVRLARQARAVEADGWTVSGVRAVHPGAPRGMRQTSINHPRVQPGG